MSKPKTLGLSSSQYDTIMESQKRQEDTLASMDRDLAHDRQDIGNFKVELSTLRTDFTFQIGKLKEELKELRSAINLNAERTRDKVADMVAPAARDIHDSVEEFKDAIEDRKIIEIKPKVKWFQFWKR